MLEWKDNPGWDELPAGAEKMIVCARLRNGSFKGGFVAGKLRWTLRGEPDDIMRYCRVPRGR